jgi:hypothetical protein
VLLSGLAEVDVQIDESRSDDQTLRPEYFRTTSVQSTSGPDRRDSPIAEQQVHLAIDTDGRIDYATA